MQLAIAASKADIQSNSALLDSDVELMDYTPTPTPGPSMQSTHQRMQTLHISSSTTSTLAIGSNAAALTTQDTGENNNTATVDPTSTQERPQAMEFLDVVSHFNRINKPKDSEWGY